MNEAIILRRKVRFGSTARNDMVRRRRNRESLGNNAGRIPRVARLMALAIQFEQMIQGGQVRDYAELARLGHVTRARLTQIMNLTLLAPDIQEEILFLPLVLRGRDPISERDLRDIVVLETWCIQRNQWRRLVPRSTIQ